MERSHDLAAAPIEAIDGALQEGHAGQLSGAIAALLRDPPPLPGWPVSEWRTALGRPWRSERLLTLLGEARLRPLVDWVVSSAGTARQLGVLAAVLAVLDAAVAGGETNVGAVAGSMERAAARARPLGSLRGGQARVSPSACMDHRAVSDPPIMPAPESRLPRVAEGLLRQAGLDLHAERHFARRLAVALDVAVEHWTAAAEPGAGLPEFPSESLLRSTKRLAVLLGRDRDLLYLIYGPQPGRGRPIQVARRRGLAYWVALGLRAERLGEEMPVVPPGVLAHWRQELERLHSSAEASEALGTDRSDAPSA